MARLDPMGAPTPASTTAASIWRRRTGAVARVDFSMIEAMLWTMADPLLAAQLPPPRHQAAEGAAFRCTGQDEWISIEPAPEFSPDWAWMQNTLGWRLTRSGIAAAALARSADLVSSEHLRARGFWNEDGLPGLPWLASFGRATGPAPGLGTDADVVSGDVLGMAADAIRCGDAGAFRQTVKPRRMTFVCRRFRWIWSLPSHGRGRRSCRLYRLSAVAGCISADGEGHGGNTGQFAIAAVFY